MTGPGTVERVGDVLTVSGDIDMASAGAIAVRGRSLLREGGSGVDLSALGEVDSAGLSVLLEWLREARSLGRALPVRGAPEQLLRLARLYQVSDLLPMEARPDPDLPLSGWAGTSA
jgi:phospholipid transport system transporter-binding protein